MIKKIGSLCLSLVLVLSLVGCGNKEVVTPAPSIPQPAPEVSVPKVPETPEIVEPEPEMEPEIEPEIDIESINFGEGSYDLRLFSTLLLKDENIQNNLCVSPFSLKQALLMVLQGAEEESNSFKELSKFLDCSGSIAEINKNIRQDNILLSSSESATFDISNLVLLDDSLAKSANIETNFIKPLEEYYFAKVLDKDLQNEDIVLDVNNFVNETTKGTIPEMINKPFNDLTKSVLLNAIYFLGKWENPFDAYSTYTSDFNGINGITQVDMMQDGRNILYKETELYKSIIMPYKSDESVINTPKFEMVLFIPTDENEQNIFEIFNNLSVEEQEYLLNSDIKDYSYEDVIVRIPKFEINNTLDLMETVNEMGLKYSVSDGFEISNILQKTYIKVDEEGTEASAVTMIEMANSCIVLEEPPKEFFADKPFMYMIRDSYTNSILFMGVISNL